MCRNIKTLANFALWARRPRALGVSLLFTGVRHFRH